MRVPSLNPKLILGVVVVEGKRYGVPLEWKHNNGILIAGLSGSGKSQTASFYLDQLAYQGVKLIICDFDSPLEEEEALSERVKHLEDSFYLPPAKSPEEIKHRLHALGVEYQKRIQDPNRRFPLMLVIDEVSAFLSYIKDDEGKAIEDFARNLLQMRKVGIRSMIIGQEWSAGFSTNLMRPIRSAFRVKILHQLDAANVKMLMDFPTSEIARKIGAQKTGHAYFNDRFMQIPMLTTATKQKTIERLKEFTPRQITQPIAVISKPVTAIPFVSYENGHAEADFDPSNTKELVRYWYLRNHTKHNIVNRLVKGRAELLNKLYDEVVLESGNTFP